VAPALVLTPVRNRRLAQELRLAIQLQRSLDCVISKAGAGFKSLADIWADTTTAQGRLMLTILGGLAEFERELILARTGDGRKRAKARGVRFGRPPLDCAPTPGGHPAARGRCYASRSGADLWSKATISRLQPSPFEAASVAAARERTTHPRNHTGRDALRGCPSWILIEPCAAPRIPLFGEFWNMFGSSVSPLRWVGDAQAGSARRWLKPLSREASRPTTGLAP